MKKSLVALVVMMAVVGGAALPPGTASAALQAYNKGYFTGKPASTPAHNVINTLVENGNFAFCNLGCSSYSKAAFITRVTNFINGSSRQDEVGAAFIIDTMEGKAGAASQCNSGCDDAGITYAKQHYTDWMNRVNNPAVTLSVATWTTSTNSAYSDSILDDFFYKDASAGVASLNFSVGGVVKYVIKIDCGNPLGDFSGLPEPVSTSWAMEGHASLTVNGNLRARSSTTAGQVTNYTVQQGDKLDFGYFIDNTGPNTATNVFGYEETGVYPASNKTFLTRGPYGSITKGTTESLNDETITAGAPGTTYCRLVGYSPTSSTDSSGGHSGSVCAVVGSPPTSFGLTPKVTANPTFADVGSTATFTYTITNDGPDKATTACTALAKSYTGSHTPGPGAGDPTEGTQPSFKCSNLSVTADQIVATEKVTITAGMLGQTICRALTVNPGGAGTGGSGSKTSDEACVVIVNKPFFSVHGGDVSAGREFSTDPTDDTSCASAPSSGGSIVSWNREASSNYAGAGTQYAAYAIGIIDDFATAQNNSTARPAGLSYANTANVNTASGQFGGKFGGYTTCVPDYYDAMPTGAKAQGSSINVSALTTGNYSVSGSATLTGGNVNPGQQTVIYVSGNLYINGNVNYVGSWASNKIPYFQIIVKGNIYIAPNVTNLDGAYVSQGGEIDTCATASGAVSTGDANYFNICNNALTINGALVANNVEFLRTSGTVSQNNPSETINYNPSLWIAAPSSNSTGDTYQYDSITSLPPVL